MWASVVTATLAQLTLRPYSRSRQQPDRPFRSSTEAECRSPSRMVGHTPEWPPASSDTARRTEEAPGTPARDSPKPSAPRQLRAGGAFARWRRRETGGARDLGRGWAVRDLEVQATAGITSRATSSTMPRSSMSRHWSMTRWTPSPCHRRRSRTTSSTDPKRKLWARQSASCSGTRWNHWRPRASRASDLGPGAADDDRAP